MLSGLSPLVEPRLEFSWFSRDDQCCHVRLRSPGQHIGDVVLVPWRIEQSKAFVLSLKESLSHLHSLAFVAFLFVYVHNIGQMPGVSVLFLCFLFELAQVFLIDAVS